MKKGATMKMMELFPLKVYPFIYRGQSILQVQIISVLKRLPVKIVYDNMFRGNKYLKQWIILMHGKDINL